MGITLKCALTSTGFNNIGRARSDLWVEQSPRKSSLNNDVKCTKVHFFYKQWIYDVIHVSKKPLKWLF